MKKYREIIGGATFFVLAAAYFVMAFGIKRFGAGQPGIVTSDFMPKIYGAFMLILSAIQILQGVWQLKAQRQSVAVDAGVSSESGKRFPVEPEIMLTFLLLIVYVGLLKTVGFLIMSVLFIIGLTFLLLPKEERSVKKCIEVLMVAVLFTVVIYLIFVKGFHLTLPVGILG
ncbi:MAG TPA: tripartite tricarboxylate transporter TctB family protein [Clostridia bacterium]|nr:tripartite tricarboxylate transporter TctB family protein [Clostridia bacterium]